MATLLVNNIEKSDFEKQPHEIFSITIDFTDELDSGNVTAYSVQAWDSDGTDATATVTDGISEAAGVVTIGIKNGSDGETYTITSKVTSDTTTPSGTPYVFEADIKMKVKQIDFY